jgi:RNase P subunit RPR2
MALNNPVAMSLVETIAVIKFDKHNENALNALNKGKLIKLSRTDKDGRTYLSATLPELTGFTFEEYDGDLEDVRSRIPKPLRTNRLDGESIQLGLIQGSSLENSCGMMFITRIDNDEFAVFVESQFEYLNKTYEPKKYDPTSLSLPDSIVKRATTIIRSVEYERFDSISVNECRSLTLELEEIIDGKATNELRKKAITTKRKLEAALKTILSRKRNAVMGSAFKELHRNVLIENLKEFITNHHGNDVLSRLEQEALHAATQRFGIDTNKTKALFERNRDIESELSNVRREMSSMDEADILNDYFDGTYPPKVSIFRCKKCGGFSKLSFNQQIKVNKKQALVKCTECDNVVHGQRTGPSAIYAWNLENITSNRLKSLSAFSLNKLKKEEALSRLKRFRVYHELKVKELKLMSVNMTTEQKKLLNQTKGLNTSFGDFITYANKLIS